MSVATSSAVLWSLTESCWLGLEKPLGGIHEKAQTSLAVQSAPRTRAARCYVLRRGAPTLVAAATGLQPATSNFFEVTVGPAVAIVLESGNNQTGAVNTVLADSVAVRVVDAGGNGVSGINVSWTATAGGGLIRPALIPSDADGLAKAEWTLGPNPVVNTATATAAGLTGSPVTFTAGPP